MGNQVRSDRRGSAARNSTARNSTARNSAARKIAAQRAAQQTRRRRLLLAGGSVAVVIAIVVAFVAVKTMQKPAAAVTTSRVTLAGVAREITGVPPGTLSSAGTSEATALQPTQGSQPPLTSGGKPEVFYAGAEFCPYCAAERWALTVALSRFGTFSGLRFIHSAPDDGDIPTLTFYGSRYTSRYLSFAPVEWYKEDRSVLQAPTSAQLAVFNKYSGPPYVSSANSHGLPFLDLGNKYLVLGAQYNPAVLSGLSWNQIAKDIATPGSQVGQAIDSAANVITKGLCQLTHGAPSSACAAPAS